MKLKEWLADTINLLKKTGIATARLDALIMLEDLLGKDRTHLVAHDDQELTREQISVLSTQIKRRLGHEPLAYIRGKTEFYGREFIVSADTLEPRPETETMIDVVKAFLKDGPGAVVDAGTGSGCLAITAKLEFPDTEVFATDISEECLKIARQNAQKHTVDITFFQGDLLTPIPKSHFTSDRTQNGIILANLPYVPDSHTINQAAMQEPKIAIFGGPDGLDLYRQLFEQLKIQSAAYVLTEALPFQHEELTNIAKKAGYQLAKTDDFIQVFTLS